MASDHKIQKTNVTQQVAEYIRDNIESNRWPEGSRIESETQMAEKLGVSRASIRVAIRQFIAYGRLESIQGKGTFVRPGASMESHSLFSSADSADIEKVMQFRTTIERDAAFYAAQHATPEDIAFLEENVKNMTAADQAKDLKLSWKYDMEFHMKIAEMSQNKFYQDSLDMVFRSTYDLHFKIIEQLGVRFANYFHPAILDAVSKHHSEKARTCMTRHLEDFIEMIRVNQ
nr:FadR/GntR family transcriptional regulator [uncultured Dysosmobacter sp.]